MESKQTRFKVTNPEGIKPIYECPLSENESLVFDTNAYPFGYPYIGVSYTIEQLKKIAFVDNKGRLTYGNIVFTEGYIVKTVFPMKVEHEEGLVKILEENKDKFLSKDSGIPQKDVKEYILPVYKMLDVNV